MTHLTRGHWIATAFVALLVGACAGGPAEVPVNAVERSAYEAARSKVETDPAEAERGLAEFVATYPQSPLAPKADLRLGELARERGDEGAALARFEDVVEKYPDHPLADIARVRSARIELDRGDAEAATRTLGGARLSRIPPRDRQAAYRILASAAPDPVAKLRWLARLRKTLETEDGDITAVDGEIDALISELDGPAIDRAVEQIGREIPGARLWIRRGQMALEVGDIDGAERDLKRSGSYPDAPSSEAARDTLERQIELARSGGGRPLPLPSFEEVSRRGPPKTSGAGGALGVVLPLSGRFARFGEESLNGVLLAAGVFDELADANARAHTRLVIRDSAGRPERAAAAVRELAADDSVTAIIGPLLKGECEAAAAAAQSEEIPLLALTARSEVAVGRSQVFRVRTQPSHEIQVLADHAVTKLGLTRFAILYPRDAYGRGLRALFWDAVEDRGGQVVAVGSYDPDATDFADSIRRLVGYELLGGEEKAIIKEREGMLRRARRLPPDEALSLREEARALTTAAGAPLPPIVDFEALFIPESHEKVVLIAPQLAFHDVVGAQLLGASGWDHPDLLTIGRHHVVGALYTSHYFAESPLPYVKDFDARYRATFASEPDFLAAQAFDAANLVLMQLARGREDRDEIRDAVLDTRAFPGVSGALMIDADGNALKRPYLLNVNRRGVTQIN